MCEEEVSRIVYSRHLFVGPFLCTTDSFPYPAHLNRNYVSRIGFNRRLLKVTKDCLRSHLGLRVAVHGLDFIIIGILKHASRLHAVYTKPRWSVNEKESR